MLSEVSCHQAYLLKCRSLVLKWLLISESYSNPIFRSSSVWWHMLHTTIWRHPRDNNKVWHRISPGDNHFHGHRSKCSGICHPIWRVCSSSLSKRLGRNHSPCIWTRCQCWVWYSASITSTSQPTSLISKSGSSPTMKTGAIAAIVVVIAIALVASTVGLFFFMRRRKRLSGVSELPAENIIKPNVGQSREYYRQADSKSSLPPSRDSMSERKGGLRVATELQGNGPVELPVERWSHYNNGRKSIQELESPVSPP